MKITNIDLQNTGGHCYVLYIETEELKEIKTIGLNDETICLFESPLSEVETGLACEHSYIDMTVGRPWEDLGDIIGFDNSYQIKEVYDLHYLKA